MADQERAVQQQTQITSQFESKLGTFAKDHPIVMVLSAIILLSLSAQVTIPIGPVPITMQIFALAFIVATFPLDRAVEAVGGYVIAGAVGAPVFAGFKAGAVSLLGYSGGFIWGMVPGVIAACALLALLRRIPAVQTNRLALFAALMAAGLTCTLVMYICGCAQYGILFGADFAAIMAACVTPFIGIDLCKVALASAIGLTVYRR